MNYSLSLSSILPFFQISMHDPGTSRRRSAPCGSALRSSTAGAMTKTRTVTLRLWTTACRACWASASCCPRTFTTAMRCGWRERCSPSRSSGRGFCRNPDGWEERGGRRMKTKKGVWAEDRSCRRMTEWFGGYSVHQGGGRGWVRERR